MSDNESIIQWCVYDAVRSTKIMVYCIWYNIIKCNCRSAYYVIYFIYIYSCIDLKLSGVLPNCFHKCLQEVQLMS